MRILTGSGNTTGKEHPTNDLEAAAKKGPMQSASADALLRLLVHTRAANRRLNSQRVGKGAGRNRR